MNKFAYRLRDLRREFNISGKTLAQWLDVTDANVSQWETGRNYPNQAVLEKIADYFDVSLDYLMGRTEEKRSHYSTQEQTSITARYERLTETQKLIVSNLIDELLKKSV